MFAVEKANGKAQVSVCQAFDDRIDRNYLHHSSQHSHVIISPSEEIWLNDALARSPMDTLELRLLWYSPDPTSKLLILFCRSTSPKKEIWIRSVVPRASWLIKIKYSPEIHLSCCLTIALVAVGEYKFKMAIVAVNWNWETDQAILESTLFGVSSNHKQRRARRLSCRCVGENRDQQ